MLFLSLQRTFIISPYFLQMKKHYLGSFAIRDGLGQFIIAFKEEWARLSGAVC